ncbi:MAG: T9SS type A sorting domain-containing protein [bacterium]
MNKILIIFLFELLLGANLTSQEIKGDTSSIDDIKIIKVWGTHQERGFAYGYLLAGQIVDLIDNYLFAEVFYNDLQMYENNIQLLKTNFNFDEKYLIEARAIIDGMIAAGYGSELQQLFKRVPDVNDMIFVNTIVEFAYLGCSSLALWGEKTQYNNVDAVLIYTRNLDWTKSNVLIRNQLITVHIPEESDEQPWISFGFPGLFGILSGINQSGVGAFLHLGNIGSFAKTSGFFHPIFLSIRNGIESKDFDGNQNCNTSDVEQSIKEKQTAGGFIVNVVGKRANSDSVIVVEVNNFDGCTMRTSSENTTLSGSVIASTNHFRKLYPPVDCYRYDNIESILKGTNEKVNDSDSWQILTDAAGVPNALQTIQYLPDYGLIKLAVANITTPSHQREAHQLYLNELTSIDDSYKKFDKEKIILYPNPMDDKLYIESQNLIKNITVYNFLGQILMSKRVNAYKCETDLNNILPGLYFITIDGRVRTFIKR